MSKEADRLIAEFLGWTDIWDNITYKRITGIEPVTGCRMLLPAFSTLDSAALEGLQTLPKKFGWEIQFNGKSYFVSIWWKLPHEAEEGEACSVWNVKEKDSIHAALEDAMVEEYVKRLCNYTLSGTDATRKAYRIKPAIEQALKGGSGE